MESLVIVIASILLPVAALLRSQTPPATQPIDVASPTVVSLDLRDAAPADAARALAEQAGVPHVIALVQDRAPTTRATTRATTRGATTQPAITLRIEREPYLVALAKLCVAAGAEPFSVSPARVTLKRLEGSAPLETKMSGPAHASGPFLVVAQGVTATKSVQVTSSAPDDSPDLNVQLALFAEPKVLVVGTSPWVRVTEAADETGSLIGAQPQHPTEWPDFRSLGAHDTFPAALAPGRPVGRRIVTLKGFIDVRVASGVEVVRIDDVTAPREGMLIRGMKLSSTAAAPRGPSAAVIELHVERGGDIDEMGWQRFTHYARLSRLIVRDAEGRPLPQQGDQYPRHQGNRLVVTIPLLRTSKPPDGKQIGPPASLEWHFPAELKEVEVPFEFKDLPLP
jgi:hypothetical protein